MSHRLLDSMRCKSSPRERRWRHRTSSTTDFPEAAGAFSPIFFAARTTRRTACEQMDCVSGNDTHLARPLGPTAPATTDSRKNHEERARIEAEIERLRSPQENQFYPSCLLGGVAARSGLTSGLSAPATTDSWKDKDYGERAKIQAEIEKLRAAQENESCPSCLYVGVATSLGLAAYFTHLALEKVDERTLSEAARRQQRYNKPVFLAFSVGWVAIGAYRWHLG